MHRAVPKSGSVTDMTNEDLLVHAEMIDEDQGREPFLSAGSLEEGVTGTKKIDTQYENYSCDYVENPREATTPAPDCLTGPMYPHRNL